MMININLQKKKQRYLTAKKRLSIHQNINKKNLLLGKQLNEIHWFNKKKNNG